MAAERIVASTRHRTGQGTDPEFLERNRFLIRNGTLQERVIVRGHESPDRQLKQCAVRIVLPCRVFPAVRAEIDRRAELLLQIPPENIFPCILAPPSPAAAERIHGIHGCGCSCPDRSGARAVRCRPGLAFEITQYLEGIVRHAGPQQGIPADSPDRSGKEIVRHLRPTRQSIRSAVVQHRGRPAPTKATVVRRCRARESISRLCRTTSSRLVDGGSGSR